MKTIIDPIQEKIVWQNIHNDAKTSLKRGVKKLFSPKDSNKNIFQGKVSSNYFLQIYIGGCCGESFEKIFSLRRIVLEK